jgi:hypothetical protein
MEVNVSNRGSFFLRLLGALILTGALLAGGALLFRAGQAQGYQMGVTAGAAANGETPETAPVVPYSPGYWPAYGPYYPGPHFGFFPFAPFGGLCGSILLVFLALFALRLIFRPRFWGHPGYWHGHPHPAGGPPWTRGWGPEGTGEEKQAHGDQPPAGSEG